MAISVGKRHMLNILMFLVVGLVLLIVILGIVLSFRANEFNVSMSIEIDTPPEVVFPHVNQFVAWEAWSPYEKLDPNMSKMIQGPLAGEGAVMRWSGNGNAGIGSATIVQSEPNEAIRIELVMTSPMNCRNDVLFTFEPQGDGTIVTWSMTGQVSFMAKLVHLILDVDKMCGDQFTEGLSRLKEISEQQTTAVMS